MLMDRAYNPLLSQAENSKRVKRLLGEIKEAKQSREAMAQYWKDNNGSLVGYSGPSVRDAFGLPETPDESAPNINDSTGGTTFNPDEFELIED
jgi:hypothetical protein